MALDLPRPMPAHSAHRIVDCKNATIGCCGGFSLKCLTGGFIDVGRVEDYVFVHHRLRPDDDDEVAQLATACVIAFLPRLQFTTCSLGLHEVGARSGPADDEIRGADLPGGREVLDHAPNLTDPLDGVPLYAMFAQLAHLLVQGHFLATVSVVTPLALLTPSTGSAFVPSASFISTLN